LKPNIAKSNSSERRPIQWNCR